jgi:hypothetical protein
LSPDDAKQELSFVYNNGASSDEVEATEAKTDSEEDTAETEAVVYEEVTEYVNVTDADGEPVTDENGTVQTEAVIVETKAVSGGSDNTSAETSASGNSSTYTASYDTCKAYWLDMSQQSDFYFEGEFLVIEFQVNEDIPDGSYPVTISQTDIASWDLVSYDPVIIDGEVAVNTDPAKQASASDSDFTLVVNSVTAKQGDTVKVTIDLANNPGFCGCVIDIQYDAAALTIVDTYGGSDFDQAVNYIN